MVFLHTGDLHIGRSLGEFSLIEDQRFILDQIVSIAAERGADAVLVAGDVYDKSIPSEAAVGLFDAFLLALAERGIRAFIIPGNHDSDERVHFGSGLFRARGIYISARFDGTLARETLTDQYGPVTFYLLPFLKASQARHFYPDEEIPDYEAAVRTVLDRSAIDPAARNVLVAHQFVTGGGAEPRLGGSESAAVQAVGLVERIGADCFDRFDYVALGHIHAAQAVGRETVRYAGSPLKYSLNEAGQDKSVTLVRLGEKGDVETELVPLRPLRDLRHIRGRMEQLLAREHIRDRNDFLYVTLTDEAPIDNAMGIFQQDYPNTVRIEYDNAYTRALQDGNLAGAEEHQSFGEIVSAFYRMIYGADISGQELALLREAAKEAGIADETD